MKRKQLQPPRVNPSGKVGQKIMQRKQLQPTCQSGKVLNPATGRCVNKTGVIGQKIMKRKQLQPPRVNPSGKVGQKIMQRKQLQPTCQSGKVLNPATGRCVIKTGKIGQQIMQKSTGKQPYTGQKKIVQKSTGKQPYTGQKQAPGKIGQKIMQKSTGKQPYTGQKKIVQKSTGKQPYTGQKQAPGKIGQKIIPYASMRIKATTWNGARYDNKYKTTVNPDKMCKEHGQFQDFVLLQEADSSTFRPFQAAGFACTEGMRGTAICYKSARFTPTAKKETHKLDNPSRSGTAWALGQKFYDKYSKKTISVVTVHAGHNKNYHDKKKENESLRTFVRSMGDADVHILGGDFNEMTTVVDSNTIGAGFSTRDTHKMGANSKIGVKGKGFTSARSSPASSSGGHPTWHSKWGSDHDAIKLTVDLKQ